MVIAAILVAASLFAVPRDGRSVPLGLAAEHRNAEIPASDDFFGPMIGDWKIRSVFHTKHGVVEVQGIWSFRRILNGTAVEDVIATVKQDDDKFFRGGVAVRYYQPSTRTWLQTYIEPISNTVQKLIGRKEGERIVQTVQGSNPVETWTFEKFSPNSFYWVDRFAAGNGNPARVDQEIFATRMRPGESI